MRRRIVTTATALIAPVASVWLLYRDALRLGWTYDDAFHLHQVFTHSLRTILFDPSFIAQLPNKVFTPFLFLSIKFDLALFGAHDPYAYYVHQLTAMAGVAVASFFVARLWLSDWRASLAAILVIAGPLMGEIAAELYHRHYIEGLIFALASVIAFVLGLRSQRRSLFIASALLYFAAAACKEVFVPLPLILAFLPEVALPARARALVAHGVAVAAYAIWRIAMVGRSLEGYGLVAAPEERTQTFLTLPWRVITRASSDEGVILAVVAVVIALCLRRPLLLAASLIAAVAPIVPVSFQIEARYALVAWTLLAFAAAITLLLAPRVWRRVVFAAFFVAVVVANRAEWRNLYPELRRMSLEAQFILNGPDGSVLLEPATPPAAVIELRWMRGELFHRPGTTTALYDALPVCTNVEQRPLFRYYEPMRAIQPVSRGLVERIDCRSVRDVPFEVHLESDGRGNIYWALAPAMEGEHRFLIADGVQSFVVPSKGGFRLGRTPALPIRIRYKTPADVISYSPQFMVDPWKPSEVHWRR